MPKVVVHLSGELNSTTTLAISKLQSFDNYALSFDYGQNKGEACGEYDPCVLRQNGFTQAGVIDPTKYQ